MFKDQLMSMSMCDIINTASQLPEIDSKCQDILHRIEFLQTDAVQMVKYVSELKKLTKQRRLSKECGHFLSSITKISCPAEAATHVLKSSNKSNERLDKYLKECLRRVESSHV